MPGQPQLSYRQLVEWYSTNMPLKPYRKPQLVELAARDPKSRHLVGLELVRRLEKAALSGKYYGQPDSPEERPVYADLGAMSGCRPTKTNRGHFRCGADNPRWAGDRRIDREGYVMAAAAEPSECAPRQMDQGPSPHGVRDACAVSRHVASECDGSEPCLSARPRRPRRSSRERRGGRLAARVPLSGAVAVESSADNLVVDSERRAEIMGRYWARLHELTPLTTGGRNRWNPLEPSTTDTDEEHALSPRQLEVLRLVADGLNNREIAERLYISEETAKSHIKKILSALRAESRAHAVAVAFRSSLLN